METGLVVDAVRSPWESELDQKVIGGAIVTNRRTHYGKGFTAHSSGSSPRGPALVITIERWRSDGAVNKIKEVYHV